MFDKSEGAAVNDGSRHISSISIPIILLQRISGSVKMHIRQYCPGRTDGDAISVLGKRSIIQPSVCDGPVQIFNDLRVDLIGWSPGNIDVIQGRSEEHTSELQSRGHIVCRLLLEKKKVRTASRRT